MAKRTLAEAEAACEELTAQLEESQGVITSLRAQNDELRARLEEAGHSDLVFKELNELREQAAQSKRALTQHGLNDEDFALFKEKRAAGLPLEQAIHVVRETRQIEAAQAAKTVEPTAEA